MRVLVACEFSGIVREAFSNCGHDAWSCDLLPTEIPGNHIQDDVLKHLNDGWDLMVAHPPCTYLANSGVQYLHIQPDRQNKMLDAVAFFLKLLNAPIEKICVENPLPHGYANLPPCSQIIHPYWFGDEVDKKTLLWLKNLPLLTPTKMVDRGKRYIGKNGKVNGSEWYQLRSQNWKNRSRTFRGVAEAMASQWGGDVIAPYQLAMF